MSNLREEVNAIRAEKLSKPHKLDSYRLIADHTNKTYKVTIKYIHDRDDPKYVTHESPDHKEIVKKAVGAPNEI